MTVLEMEQPRSMRSCRDGAALEIRCVEKDVITGRHLFWSARAGKL